VNERSGHAARHSSGSASRVVFVGLGAGALLALGLYASAYAATGSGVPKGTQVLGIDIGGRSVQEAQTALEKGLPTAVGRTISVTAAQRAFPLDVSAAGVEVDVQETVARAGRRSLNPVDLVPKLFGSKDALEPVLAVDDAKLTGAVNAIAKKVDQKGTEGGIRFVDGVPTRTAAVEGRRLDVHQTAAEISAAVRRDLGDVVARVLVTSPVVPAAAVDAAMRDFAVPAMSGPVTLDVGDGTIVTLAPKEIGGYLTLDAADGTLVPAFDGKGLANSLAKNRKGLGTPSKDASFAFDDQGRPRIVPGRNGRELDPEQLSASMLTVLRSTTARTVTAGFSNVEPETTTADLEALGIKEQISSFRTQYPIAPYRITNIGRAARLINKSLVLPGETWSLNKTIGERTAANGFVKGFIIREGNFAEDLGGGVSQSATTTFNAVFFAGLKDVEHHPHSLYISRYPAGREATVAFGTKDLRFQNDSGHGVLIHAVGKPGFIRVTMWGTKKYERIESVSSGRYNIRSPKSVVSVAADCQPQVPADGFDIDVTRIFYLDGQVVKREKFNTHYDATDKITCEKPKPSPSPKPSKNPDPVASAAPPGLAPGPAATPGSVPPAGGGSR
jgi:vancomycin resistance protein YoaR